MCTADTDDIISNSLNADALSVMEENDIAVCDTHARIVEQCGAAPVSECFGVDNCYCPHCAGGYDYLANEVIAPAIRALLEE